jgi:hypothetical protein
MFLDVVVYSYVRSPRLEDPHSVATTYFCQSIDGFIRFIFIIYPYYYYYYHYYYYYYYYFYYYY